MRKEYDKEYFEDKFEDILKNIKQVEKTDKLNLFLENYKSNTNV